MTMLHVNINPNILWSSLVAQWVKDLVFSLLWLRSLLWHRFDSRPKISTCCRHRGKKIKKKILSWSGWKVKGRVFVFLNVASNGHFSFFFFTWICLFGYRGDTQWNASLTWLDQRNKKHADLSAPLCRWMSHSHSQDGSHWPIPDIGSAFTRFCLFLHKYWRRKDNGWIPSNLVSGTSDL